MNLLVVLIICFISCQGFQRTRVYPRKFIRPLYNDNLNTFDSTDDDKKYALELLDSLTSPSDSDDPYYDVEKDVRRDELLLANDYQELKLELKERGLRTSGDKTEMMIRLLLHIVDPTLSYDPSYGVEPTLKYIDSEDLSTNKVKILPPNERKPVATIDDIDIDADDVQTITRTDIYSSTKRPSQRIIMDGLSRREIDFHTQYITQDTLLSTITPPTTTTVSTTTSSPSDNDNNNNKDKTTKRTSSSSSSSSSTTTKSSPTGYELKTNNMIKAYIVGGRDVLKTWSKTSSVIILCPDEKGWKCKSNRLIADEIAFANQAIVIVPDIYDQSYSHGWYDSVTSDPSLKTSSLSHINHYKVIDNIIASLHYARQQYHPKSISIIGIGTNGCKYAIESTCHLWDIASFSMLQLQVDEIEMRSMFEGVSQPDHIQLLMNSTIKLGHAERLAKNATYDLYDLQLIYTNSSQVNSKTDTQQLNSQLNNNESTLGGDSSSSSSSSSRGSSSGNDYNNGFIPTITSDDNDSSSSTNKGDSMSIDDIDDEDMDTIMNNLLKKIVNDNRKQEGNTDMPPSNPKKTLTEEEEEIIKKAEERTKRRQEEEIRQQKLQQIRQQQQLVEDQYIRQASQRVVDQKLLSRKSTLKPADLVHLAPRALLLYQPFQNDDNNSKDDTDNTVKIQENLDNNDLESKPVKKKSVKSKKAITKDDTVSTTTSIGATSSTPTDNQYDTVSIRKENERLLSMIQTSLRPPTMIIQSTSTSKEKENSNINTNDIQSTTVTMKDNVDVDVDIKVKKKSRSKKATSHDSADSKSTVPTATTTTASTSVQTSYSISMIQKLHQIFMNNIEYIEDYSIRLYENCPKTFMSNPIDIRDRKSRQNALMVGGMWLDAYSRDISADRTYGIGRTKYDPTQGYFVLKPLQIDLLSDVPSGVTEAIHEEELSNAIDYLTQDNYYQ